MRGVERRGLTGRHDTIHFDRVGYGLVMTLRLLCLTYTSRFDAISKGMVTFLSDENERAARDVLRGILATALRDVHVRQEWLGQASQEGCGALRTLCQEEGDIIQASLHRTSLSQRLDE